MQLFASSSIQDNLGTHTTQLSVCQCTVCKCVCLCVFITPQSSMFLQQSGRPRQGVWGSSWHSSMRPAGQQRRPRRRVLTSVAVNLDVQEQLIFLPTPVDRKPGTVSEVTVKLGATQSRIKNLNQHAAKALSVLGAQKSD